MTATETPPRANTDIEEELLQALDVDERVTLRRLTARVLHAAEPHDDPAKDGSFLIVALGVDLALDEKLDTPRSLLDAALRHR